MRTINRNRNTKENKEELQNILEKPKPKRTYKITNNFKKNYSKKR